MEAAREPKSFQSLIQTLHFADGRNKAQTKFPQVTVPPGRQSTGPVGHVEEFRVYPEVSPRRVSGRTGTWPGLHF